MGMISEFKEFIMRGNVMDMAVGVIVGGAFNTIVSSLVDDIIMPVISLATGKIDFTSLFVALDGGSYKSLAQAKEEGAAVFAYGSFIQNVLQFLIVAFVLFLVIKGMNKLRQAGSRRRLRPPRSARSARTRFRSRQPDADSVPANCPNNA